MELEIIKNSATKKVSEVRLKGFLKKCLKTAKSGMKFSSKSQLELYFVSDLKMARLNKEFRGKNKTTDILSFSFLEGLTFPGGNLIGQIFISPKIALKQAKKNGWSLEKEIEFLFVHGVLHVLGFDHENRQDFLKMFKLHEKILGTKFGAKKIIEKYYQESF